MSFSTLYICLLHSIFGIPQGVHILVITIRSSIILSCRLWMENVRILPQIADQVEDDVTFMNMGSTGKWMVYFAHTSRCFRKWNVYSASDQLWQSSYPFAVFCVHFLYLNISEFSRETVVRVLQRFKAWRLIWTWSWSWRRGKRALHVTELLWTMRNMARWFNSREISERMFVISSLMRRSTERKTLWSMASSLMLFVSHCSCLKGFALMWIFCAAHLFLLRTLPSGMSGIDIYWWSVLYLIAAS